MLLQLTVVYAEFAAVGIFTGRLFFFGAALDFDSLEPFLPLFSDEADFHFVTLAQLAGGVHEIFVARNDNSDKIIAFKGLYEERQILALAYCAFGSL
ncbi:MAG: hypothetical protein ACYS3N_11735 [Planctomycetota bacterium]